jgi:hypothetical protein
MSDWSNTNIQFSRQGFCRSVVEMVNKNCFTNGFSRTVLELSCTKTAPKPYVTGASAPKVATVRCVSIVLPK